jgi:hypothetical protein
MIFILAPSAWGKDHPLWCGKKLMIMAGWPELIGPGNFVSGRGFIRFLKRTKVPLAVCFVDEVGDLFRLVNSQEDNPWVTDIVGLFKQLYASWGLIITAESVGDKSVTINHPAISLVTFGTPESVFEMMTPRDVEGGWANRPMYFPFDGFRRPPEQDAPEGIEEPPKELVEALKRLRPKKTVEEILKTSTEQIDKDLPAPPVQPSERRKIPWANEAARQAYFKFSREIDGYEEEDKRKFNMGKRAADNAVRCATIVAAGCFSPTVDVRDIEWALKWSRVSVEAACGGFDKYMNDYFKFPKFCAEVVEAIQHEDGFMSNRELNRKFRRNMKYGGELEKALRQLVDEQQIRKAYRSGERGPTSDGYEIWPD